ncbi:MAG: YdaU family protein [Parcubacteria group bacterium]
MQLYVADYLGDTRHLSTEQHGAYLLLLMAMWRAGGRLPNEAGKLARIVGLTKAKWLRMEADILAFFEPADGEITHGRIEKEMQKYSRISTERSEAGRRGGAAKALKNNKTTVANATDLPKQNPAISEPESDTSRAKALSVRARASRRCPPEWEPSEITGAKLIAEGFTAGDLERALTRMRDHEFKTARCDWDAAYRNWVRADKDRQPRAIHERSDPIQRKRDQFDSMFAGAESAARRRALERAGG